MIRAHVSEWLRRKRGELILALSETRTIHGIAVLVTNSGRHAPNDHLFEKISAALDLIAQYQPMRLRRIQQEFARIWVTRQSACRAAYQYASRSCILDTFFVATFPEAQIASSIVHEGVHARVYTAGATVDDPAREERLCRKAELRFGLSIPGGEAVVERAREALALSDEDIAPKVDWEEERRMQARAAINDLPLPGWLKRRIARWTGLGELAA